MSMTNMQRNEAALHQGFSFHQIMFVNRCFFKPNVCQQMFFFKPKNQLAGRNYEWAETLPPTCVEKLALCDSMENWIYDACNLVQLVLFWLGSIRFTFFLVYGYVMIYSPCKNKTLRNSEAMESTQLSCLCFSPILRNIICFFFNPRIQFHCWYFVSWKLGVCQAASFA